MVHLAVDRRDERVAAGGSWELEVQIPVNCGEGHRSTRNENQTD